MLPEGMVIGENADEDARRFHRSEQGIVLVTKPMLDALAKQEQASDSITDAKQPVSA